jgi:ABC-type microcin C transport system duplicated ATPase subunit YejF
MTGPVLELRNVAVEFATLDGPITAVKSVSLQVQSGETLAIVGESGSGKSQLMMAALCLLAANGTASGEAIFGGQNLIGMSKAELNKIRGRKITMIFQEPMTSLDPLYTIGDQLIEPIMQHRLLPKTKARARALDLLNLVRIPDAERRLTSYPHEMSGGQRQRVMIAMALANDPELLIADEPTTALDVTVQAEILDLIAELQKKLGMAVVFITHDLNIVRRIANRVVVMQHGKVVEQGDTQSVFRCPEHQYTRDLIAAEPSGTKSPPDINAPVLLSAQNMTVSFKVGTEFLQKNRKTLVAVDNVSLSLTQGETVGIVGESGSGKSTLARAILKLLSSEGTVEFEGQQISHFPKSQMRPLRQHMQIVFQDPFGSLSPRMTVGQIVSEGLRVHGTSLTALQRDQRACETLESVQIDPAIRNRYPHEFSGGQRQRIAIARAIILQPKLIVLDEPTSALDRQVQKQIIDLLRNLQERHGLSYLFISHDLAVVQALADRIVVMKDGRIVEQGTTESVMKNPQQTYTQQLMKAAFT